MAPREPGWTIGAPQDLLQGGALRARRAEAGGETLAVPHDDDQDIVELGGGPARQAPDGR